MRRTTRGRGRWSVTEVPAELPPEQAGAQCLTELGNVGGGVDRSLTGFWVALPEEWSHDLLDQTYFPIDGVPVEAQMPWLDPVATEIGCDAGGHECILVVVHGPGDDHRLENSESLESGQIFGRQPGGGLQLVGSHARARAH